METFVNFLQWCRYCGFCVECGGDADGLCVNSPTKKHSMLNADVCFSYAYRNREKYESGSYESDSKSGFMCGYCGYMAKIPTDTQGCPNSPLPNKSHEWSGFQPQSKLPR